MHTCDRVEACRGAYLALLDGAAVLLVQAVRDGGRRGLVDDAHDVHPRDHSGVLGRLRIATCMNRSPEAGQVCFIRSLHRHSQGFGSLCLHEPLL